MLFLSKDFDAELKTLLLARYKAEEDKNSIKSVKGDYLGVLSKFHSLVLIK